MTLSRSNPRAKSRWTILILVVSALALVVAATALAVHEQSFQLDGDTSTTDIAPLDGVTRNVDWDSVYDATGQVRASLPTGYQAGGLRRDFRVVASGNKAGQFDTSDGSTFTGGSKDTLDISTGWRCVGANNVTQKGDITNAYAALLTNASNERVLYFGMEKYAPQGTNNIGVWFLQDDTVGCAENGTGNGNAFTGQHRNGDLLVVSAFSNGGAVSTILAYTWQDGALVLETPTAGVDCRATTAGDNICGAANTAPIDILWPSASNADGQGQAGSAQQPAATFFEGGIKLSAFPSLANRCFSKFLFNTRASTATTSTIYDYAVGQLGECKANVTTTPQTGTGGTIPATGLNLPAPTASVSVRDSAVMSVDGISTWSGTLAFRLCGPTPLSDTDFTLCAPGGGTLVSSHSVSNSTAQPINSTATTVTSAGRYCWRADFTPDAQSAAAGVPTGADNRATECFKVNPVTPTLTTQALTSDGNPVTGAIPFGQPIRDRASLSGTTTQPGSPIIGGSPGSAAGGTITFKLYGPSSTGTPTVAQCAALPLATNFPTAGLTVSVSGDSTSYDTASPGFTPAAPGFYFWKASYDGSSPNTNPSGEHNTNCDQGNERVEVQQLPSTISTVQTYTVKDTATISVSTAPPSGTLSGSVRFRLFESLTACQNRSTSPAPLVDQSVNLPTGSALSKDVETTPLSITTSKASLYWLVEFTSTNSAIKHVTHDCVENSSLNIVNGGSTTSP